MVYQAPIVAAIILASYIWRSITFRLEKQGKKIPLFAHYYTVLYLMLAVLTVLAVEHLYTDVLVVTDWLDKDKVRDFVWQVMKNSAQDAPLLNNTLTSPFKAWEKEADLKDKQWLKYMALASPCWALLCLLVCAYHTWDHVKLIRDKNQGGLMVLGKARSKDGKDEEVVKALWSDCIILILVLPAVYCLMSLQSVVRCLQIYINHIPAGGTDAKSIRFHSYSERKQFLNDMYAANFAVGDIMETVALVTFGQLIADYLKKKAETTERHMRRKGCDEDDIETLQAAGRTVSELAVAGVGLFCLACLLDGGWDLVITAMPQYFPKVAVSYFGTTIDPNTGEPEGSLQQEATRSQAENFFLGFSFAASFAAIGNIMTLEENYHHFLKEFSPSLKFWGTKILVTLACVQSSLLGCLSSLLPTKEERNLVYASLLCFECLCIAIFHYKAWGAEETWLDLQHQKSDTPSEPLLHAETS